MVAASPSAAFVVPLACQTVVVSACCCRQTASAVWVPLLLLLIVSLAETLRDDLRIASVLRPYHALCVDWIAVHGVILGCVGVMVCVAVVTRLAVVVTWMIVAMGPTVVVVVV